MMLFIDKIVAWLPKQLCFLVAAVSASIAYFVVPYHYTELYVEGVISDFREVPCYSRGRRHVGWDYYFTVNGVRVQVPISEEGKFKDRRYDWYEILEGKFAKVYYMDSRSKVYTSVELDDGSYSYHDPHEHDLSCYDFGLFPFLWFVLIIFLAVLVFARYYYLLMFASDERRKAVFGDPNYLPKD